MFRNWKVFGSQHQQTIAQMLLIVSLFFTTAIQAKEPKYQHIKLIDGVEFTYQGAFRFSTETNGDSRMSYANGPFTVLPNGKDFYIVGHAQHQAIAEFTAPELAKTRRAPKLPFAIVKQPFVNILKNGSRIKNPQKLDRISGMDIIEGELFANAVEYYDAPGDNTDTTFIIRDPENLKSSKVDGFFRLQGRAHGAGWISEIPDTASGKFPGTYLLGYTNNYAINSRFSIGPSAFISNIDGFAGLDDKNGVIPAHALMDFSIKTPIHPDQYNESKKNDVWTEVSYAAYGFIEPTGKYYVLVGNSGGHHSSIGYKIKPKNGKQCGGPCAFNAKDYYNYYWIFAVEDLLAVQNKERFPSAIQPVKVGKLDVPFQPHNGKLKKVIGADFDYVNNKLWMLIENVDYSQSEFETAPVMVVYDLVMNNGDTPQG